MAAANGLMVSMGIGSFVYWSKLTLAGHDTSNDPRVWLAEAIDRSGATGWLFDIHNIVEKGTRGVVGVNKLVGGPTMSRYALRNVTNALLGPTTGLGEDVVKGVGAAATGEINRSDLRAIRRILPYQKLFYLRGLLTALEEKTADEMGAEGR